MPVNPSLRDCFRKNEKRRKLLLVTPFPYDGAGGVAVAVRELERAFVAMGNDVFVLARGPSNHIQRLDEFPEPVFGLYARTPGKGIRTWISWIVFFPVVIWSLWRFIVRNKVDAVYIQYPVAQFFYFGILRKVGRWKLFLSFQGCDAHRLSDNSRTDRLLLNFLVKNADRVTAVATSLLREVNGAFKKLKCMQAVIPNGARCIDESDQVQFFHLPDNYLIAVGMLTPRKGYDTILDALGFLKKRGEDIKLVIVGSGPERPNLETQARKLGVFEDITFLGVQSHATAVQLIRQSTAMVLASRAEGLPLVIVEAMMCGRAVIATAVDGTPDIVIQGQTGILVPPDRPEELAEAISELMLHPEKRMRFGEAGRIKAQNYEWQTIAADYYALIDDCIKSGDSSE